MAAAVKRRTRYETYGNVAYDPAYAPRPERHSQPDTRPLVRPRERVQARPRALVRPAGQVSIFAVVGFLAVGVFAVLLLMSYVQLDAVGNNVVSLRSELSQLQETNTKLQTKYETAYDLKSIEQTLTASGAMVKPQSGQTVVLDLSEPDSVQVFQQEKAVNPFAGVINGVGEAVGNVMEYFR